MLFGCYQVFRRKKLNFCRSHKQKVVRVGRGGTAARALVSASGGAGYEAKAEPGFWSCDGMVQFSTVKLSREGTLVIQGNRYCEQFESEYGEFINVRTRDKVETEIHH